MKLLLLLFTVCSIQCFVWSDVTPDRKELFSIKPLRGPLQTNVKILNERKIQKKVVSKQIFYKKPVHTGKTKRVDLKHKHYTVFPGKKEDLSNQGYTVFPPVPQSQRGIPESKYFPIFQEEEPKPSVKKVLNPVRVKRSAHKRRNLHSNKKESQRDLGDVSYPVKKRESKRALEEVSYARARRSHHKKAHRKHRKHGKKHHNSRKHKKSGHRRSKGGKGK